MNIALFASAFYPHIGGVEELVRQMALTYRASGHNVIVVTIHWPRDLPSYEEHEGTPIYRFPMRIPEGSPRVMLRYKLSEKSERHRVLDVLKKHKIEMIHVQCVSANGHFALMAAQELGIPLVVTTQGERTMDATQLYERSPFMNRTLRALLTKADFITACSRNTLDDAENWFLEGGGAAFGERARVVYNGIQLRDFETPEVFQHPRSYVLAIGRHVTQKGFDLLIEAFARANLDNVDLVIAGDGSETENLKALAKLRGVQDRVLFFGRADRKQAVALFKGCAFFVLPSRLEPQGIVNLEAMAAGKAVAAADVGGVAEIVLNEATGLLFRGDDIEDLTQVMKQLFNDSALRERLGQAGRERAQNFDWPQIAAQYLDIYNQVAQNAGDKRAK